MPDSKITALASIGTGTDPAVDPLVIVDVSDTTMAASGTTKKVTLNNLLASSPTATLASATITGDLTVATNRFAVSASGVGIGTTTMTYNLNVTGAAPTVTGIKLINTSGTSSNLCMFSASSAYSSFGVPNNAGWLAVEGSNPLAIGPTGNGGIIFVNNGSEAMRLNSTGLGVGVTPLGRLHVRQTGSGIQDVGLLENAQAAAADVGPRLGLLGVGSVAMATVESGWNGAANTDAYLSFRTRGSGAVTERLRIDSSGNVGIGVTPSAKLHVEGGGAQARFSIASASDARHEYYRNGIREGLIYWDANLVGLYATQAAGEVVIASSNTIRARVKASGQVRFVPLASDPAGAEAGDVYYNSTSNKLKCYNGTTWNDLF